MAAGAGKRRHMNVVEIEPEDQRINEKNQALYADELQTRWKVNISYIFHSVSVSKKSILKIQLTLKYKKMISFMHAGFCAESARP